jgi:CRP/FNR family transcriptional regulator, anaerobic regulatory protein
LRFFVSINFCISFEKKMLDKLLQTISQKVSFAPEDIALCEKYFEPISYPKNQIIEEQDKLGEYLYFINSGFMRLFYYDENGDENTTFFANSGDFLASYLSFIQGVKAKENIECITDCDLLRIKKTDLRTLIESSENFKQFSLLIFEKAMASSEIRANDLATLSAEQRYKKLLETQPEVLQNAPIQYIASFLGIKPQSLSRIRKNFN